MTKRKPAKNKLITNGNQKEAEARVKKVKGMLKGRTISSELFDAFLLCHHELYNTHRRYGDYENALIHSGGLRAVSQHVTHPMINRMRELGYSHNELQDKLSESKGTNKKVRSFNIEKAADFFVSVNEGRGKFDVFGILNEEEIINRIKKIYTAHLDFDDEAETPGSVFYKADKNSLINPKEFGADSLDTAELIMALEEEFDLSIPDDLVALMEYATFGELAKCLKLAHQYEATTRRS